MNDQLISIKIFNKKGQVVDRCRTRKLRRIYSFIKANKIQDCTYIVSVKYGDGYENNGEYFDKQDLVEAIKQFLEK